MDIIGNLPDIAGWFAWWARVVRSLVAGVWCGGSGILFLINR
jgi:hypothetical protein